VGTANVGSHAPVCPPFIIALCEREFTVIYGRRSDQGVDQISFLIPRSLS
jgi:hypothetical protein